MPKSPEQFAKQEGQEKFEKAPAVFIMRHGDYSNYDGHLTK